MTKITSRVFISTFDSSLNFPQLQWISSTKGHYVFVELLQMLQFNMIYHGKEVKHCRT